MEFVERGYDVDVYSPDGGPLTADTWSDPRDESGYSAHDILSLGFISSLQHAAFVEQSQQLADLDPGAYDALFLVGGQASMVTFVDGILVTGQQQYSGGAAARLVIEALGV